MGGSIVDLSKYRFQNALEDLEASKSLFDEGRVRQSVNRSYYAIFHALRAITALDQYDSRKHSGIIAYFNKTYVKAGVFGKEISRAIDSAFRLREKADYQDFYIVSAAQAQIQIERAEQIIDVVRPYLESRWEKFQT